MSALVIVCSRNTNRNNGLGIDALVIVCSWNTNRNNGLGIDALVIVCSWNTNRNNGLGIDALVIVCSWNTNVIMVWAWMLWSSYALGTGTELWFGHGCSGHRMLLEHERYYGVGMDALVIVCPWNRNGIMVWAWMLWSSSALWAAPHGGNGFPLRIDPGASPAAKESCSNHRTQGPRGCVPPKKCRAV